jgi:hypothetical protein
MVLDAGKYGLYGYRPHVTGYEEIRDDFLSYIEELKQVGPIADTTNSAKEKHWRYEHFGESPRFSIVIVYPRTLVDPTRKFEGTSSDTSIYGHVYGISFLSTGNISQTS